MNGTVQLGWGGLRAAQHRAAFANLADPSKAIFLPLKAHSSWGRGLMGFGITGLGGYFPLAPVSVRLWG